MPKVIIWREGAVESEFDPGHRDWRIGRSETNDITLLDPRKSVSRFHAELREEQGRWVFIDLNSQNGSWNAEGQRINRLVLEHGHEVLFGDYRLTFDDPPVAAPPLPPPMTATADAALQTAPVIAPDQTLLMPGAKGTAEPAPPPGPPPPVVRAASKPKAPRKGVNPVILILFVLAMLSAVGVVAWKLLTDLDTPAPVADAEPPVSESPAPAPVPPSPPAAEAAAPAASTPGATAPGAPAPLVPALPPAATPPPVTTPAPTPEPPRAVTPGKARPKRTPAAPKEAATLVARYEEGRKAFENGRYAEAQRALEAVVAQNPSFRDASALLQRARDMQVAARERALADAKQAEAAGDWTRAVALYERAGASEQASGARTRMHAAGEDAYRKARQFDARNRPSEAITLYQQAVAWLPDGDARKATAQERLAALKGGGE